MQIDGFIFDLDGTIYLGETALPGAVDLIKELRRNGKKILYITNKPLETADQYAEKLSSLGIPTQPCDILTSSIAMGSYLLRESPNLQLYVVGEKRLRNEFKKMGLQVLDDFLDQSSQQVIDIRNIDAVVLAFDRSLDYRKLNIAYQALLKGAKFYATNADKACPMPGGSIPDAGATIAALEHITGRKVDFIAGKPSAWMVKLALARLNLPVGKCLLIGDRLETDIMMGQLAGVKTALVLTGMSKKEQALSMQEPPTLILENLSELLHWIDL